MSPDPAAASTQQTVTVRFWASARAAAGADSWQVDVARPATLAGVLDAVRARGSDRLAQVVGACAVLVGDRPAGTTDPAEVGVGADEVVELLPPFAGG